MRRPRTGQLILWGATAAGAIALFFVARGLTTCWRLTPLPGIVPASCAGGGTSSLAGPDVAETAPGSENLPPAPDVLAPEIQYPKWDGGSRINVVFFGLRGGESAAEEGCPHCTDTIIVFTIDPISKTAGMFSVPRDMWVNIPGSSGCTAARDGFCRVNTAWTTGEALALPGGGPELAMKTVSKFLGVPVQYYVQVDFDTFVEMIRVIGGIDVYIDREYRLKRLGGGKDVIKITCCGMRHLSGAAALAYARCRSETQGCDDGDVGRAHRQQQVILAIRDRVLDPKRFPELMANAPEIYNTLQAGIKTNIPFDDAIRLAALGSEIPADQIQQGIVDDHMVNFGNVTANDGSKMAVLLPIPDKIRELRDKIFTTSGPTSPIAQGEPIALMQAEAAVVRVTNNSYTASLDQRTGNFLLSLGMQVRELGTPTGASDSTIVVIYTPKLYALRYLIAPLGMIASSNQIVFSPDATSPVDIEIRLGNDWAGKIPAGF
jgi:LCP family protein required for cell wall assembly